MPDGSDPRVFFAAERTLLAWLRTGLAVVGLGFVVSRFGLFLRLTTGHPPNPASAGIGVALVALGGLAAFGAAWQYARFCRTLPAAERPVGYWTGFAFWMAVAVGVAAVALAGYLAVT